MQDFFDIFTMFTQLYRHNMAIITKKMSGSRETIKSIFKNALSLKGLGL